MALAVLAPNELRNGTARCDAGGDIAAYVFSGARPSSGAETRETDAAFDVSEALERAEGAAAEDGQCH